MVLPPALSSRSGEGMYWLWLLRTILMEKSNQISGSPFSSYNLNTWLRICSVLAGERIIPVSILVVCDTKINH